MTQSDQSMQKLIPLLLAHKDDLDAFLTFAQQNHAQINTSLKFVQNHYPELRGFILHPPDSRTREAYRAKLPDADSRGLFDYMMNQPEKAVKLLDAIQLESVQLRVEIDFVDKNAPEIAKFVADHKNQLVKAAELASGSPGNAAWAKAAMTSPSLLRLAWDAEAFEKKHAEEIATIAILNGDYKGTPPRSQQEEQMQQVLLDSAKELERFVRGMPGMQALGPELTARQKALEVKQAQESAYVKAHEKDRDAQHRSLQAQIEADETVQIHKLETAFKQVKATSPDQYATLLRLERQSADLARQHVNGRDRRVDEWFDQAKQADPDQKFPLADPLELMIRSGMLSKVDDMLAHQSLPAKPVAKGQSR